MACRASENVYFLTWTYILRSFDYRKLLECHSSNRYTAQSLIEVIEHKERLDVEVLQSKLKYLSLLKDIKEKRQKIDTKDISSREDDEEVNM